MKTTKPFGEIKTAILDWARPHAETCSQFTRAANAETAEQMIEVVRDNIHWCYTHHDAIAIFLKDLFGEAFLNAHHFYTTGAHECRSGTVTALDSSTVRAYDSGTVTALDSSTVRAYDSSTVTALGSSTVTAYDSSTVTAYDSGTVTALDSSTVTALGSSTVRALDSSTVRALDSSTVTAYGSSTVTAYDSSTVTAYDSSTVRAYDSRVSYTLGESGYPVVCDMVKRTLSVRKGSFEITELP